MRAGEHSSWRRGRSGCNALAGGGLLEALWPHANDVSRRHISPSVISGVIRAFGFSSSSSRKRPLEGTSCDHRSGLGQVAGPSPRRVSCGRCPNFIMRQVLAPTTRGQRSIRAADRIGEGGCSCLRLAFYAGASLQGQLGLDYWALKRVLDSRRQAKAACRSRVFPRGPADAYGGSLASWHDG